MAWPAGSNLGYEVSYINIKYFNLVEDIAPERLKLYKYLIVSLILINHIGYAIVEYLIVLAHSYIK